MYSSALAQWQRIVLGAVVSPAAAWMEAMDMANRLIAVDRNGSWGYTCKGLLQVNAVGPYKQGGVDLIDEALANLNTAYELNPHHILNLLALCYGENAAGHSDSAIRYAFHALRISPLDPQRFIINHHLSTANLALSEYASSESFARLGISEAPGFALLRVNRAMSLVGLREFQAANAEFQEAKRLWPQFVERALVGAVVYRNPEHASRFTRLLRTAAKLERFDLETSVSRP